MSGSVDKRRAPAVKDATAQEPREPIVPVKVARALYVTIAVLALGLLFIDVTTPSDWTVDDSALGLLAVVLVLPLLEQLRKLKVGGVEVELDSFQEQIDQVRREVAATGSEIAETATEGDGGGDRELARTADSEGVIAPIDRIVWVDDVPANNDPYVEELEQRFDVLLATSTQQGVELVSREPERTLVISDAVRREGDRTNYEAGRELLWKLKETYPQVPVLVLAGHQTVVEHSDALYEAGALLVTNTFVELAKEIRRFAATRLEAAVRRAITAGQLEMVDETNGVDVIKSPTGRHIGIEVKDWLRRPTKQAINRVWEGFERLLDERKIDSAILVVPRPVVSPQQVERAPDNVSVMPFEALASFLQSLD